MTATRADAFADTVFWVALVSRADQYHGRAQAWAQRVTARRRWDAPGDGWSRARAQDAGNPTSPLQQARSDILRQLPLTWRAGNLHRSLTIGNAPITPSHPVETGPPAPTGGSPWLHAP